MVKRLQSLSVTTAESRLVSDFYRRPLDGQTNTLVQQPCLLISTGKIQLKNTLIARQKNKD